MQKRIEEFILLILIVMNILEFVGLGSYTRNFVSQLMARPYVRVMSSLRYQVEASAAMVFHSCAKL